MARSIPKKTTSKSEVYRRVTFADIVVCAVAFVAAVIVAISDLPLRFGFVLVVISIAVTLVTRVGGLPIYIYVLHFLRHFVLPKRFARDVSDEFLLDRKESKQKAFGELFVADEQRQQELNRLLEDPDVSEEVKEKIRNHRAIEEACENEQSGVEDKMKCSSMEQLCPYTAIKDGVIEYANRYFGAVLELCAQGEPLSESIVEAMRKILCETKFCANFVKIDRMVHTLVPAYYLVLFDEDKSSLCELALRAETALTEAGLIATKLNSVQTAVFLKRCNYTEFDEAQAEQISEQDLALWSMPQLVKIKANMVEVNQIVTHNFCTVTYPMLVEDGWLSKLFSLPATKCVMRFRLKAQDEAVGEIKETTLSAEQTNLLEALEAEKECLLESAFYVTAYDKFATQGNKNLSSCMTERLPGFEDFKGKIRNIFSDAGIVLNPMPFDQLHAFLGAQISAKNPCDTYLMPSATLAASGAWVRTEITELSEAESVINGDVKADSENIADSEQETVIQPQLPDLIGDEETKTPSEDDSEAPITDEENKETTCEEVEDEPSGTDAAEERV